MTHSPNPGLTWILYHAWHMTKENRTFTIRQWVLWTATGGMPMATIVAPSHKFIYPLVYFFFLLAYVVYMLVWGLNACPRKLTIHEEWQIDEIKRETGRTGPDNCKCD